MCSAPWYELTIALVGVHCLASTLVGAAKSKFGTHPEERRFFWDLNSLTACHTEGESEQLLYMSAELLLEKGQGAVVYQRVLPFFPDFLTSPDLWSLSPMMLVEVA